MSFKSKATLVKASSPTKKGVLSLVDWRTERANAINKLTNYWDGHTFVAKLGIYTVKDSDGNMFTMPCSSEKEAQAALDSYKQDLLNGDFDTEIVDIYKKAYAFRYEPTIAPLLADLGELRKQKKELMDSGMPTNEVETLISAKNIEVDKAKEEFLK